MTHPKKLHEFVVHFRVGHGLEDNVVTGCDRNDSIVIHIFSFSLKLPSLILFKQLVIFGYSLKNKGNFVYDAM